MLITISGMVGSGKSTTAAAVAELLAAAGFEARCVRFRYLRLLGFERRKRHASNATRGGGPESATQPRGGGFALRRLTAALTIGYAVRILAFRFSRLRSSSRCDVLDRYFYDNFVHYELRSRRERFYAQLLQRLIPVPDLAILLLASDRTIGERRREYAREYIVTVRERYEDLPTLFPNLVRIHTDTASSTGEEIRRAVQPLVVTGRPIRYAID